MKKILIIIIFLLFMYLFMYDEYNITEDAVRFRVIANSNSIVDIAMKEKVVEELSNVVFKNYNSEEELNDNIYNNLELINNKIDILFKKNNYDENYNVYYGLNKIPEKTFMGKKYEEGLYKSLIVEIGEGKGDNYFCILYPSLCMLDYDNKSENKQFKYKFIEVFKKIF